MESLLGFETIINKQRKNKCGQENIMLNMDCN